MSGKRIVNAYKNVDTLQAYALKDAVKIVKDNATAKFDETIDVAINLGVDPKHADQMVRGVCSLPHGNGKKVRVAVLAQGEKADEAKAAGADIVGAENLIDSILAGKVDFDRCIATPDMMGIGRTRCPRSGAEGLMPTRNWERLPPMLQRLSKKPRPVKFSIVLKRTVLFMPESAKPASRKIRFTRTQKPLLMRLSKPNRPVPKGLI